MVGHWCGLEALMKVMMQDQEEDEDGDQELGSGSGSGSRPGLGQRGLEERKEEG